MNTMEGSQTTPQWQLKLLSITMEQRRRKTIFQGILLITDLSPAYNMVDHKILLQMLQYYWFRGNEFNLIQSYLSNIMAFVQIDMARNKIMELGPYGLIQGSKLSVVSYSLYTNEIPKLHNYRNSPIFDHR